MSSALLKAVTGVGYETKDQLPPAIRRTVPMPPAAPVVVGPPGGPIEVHIDAPIIEIPVVP